MASKITAECQVTLPRSVLEQLAIGPGSEVEFRHAADGSIVLERAVVAPPLDPDRFAKLRGIAGPGPPTDEIMASLRGD
jgi:bifunctional DNA-binding transcriptional regulator/antitoxin component of YhaV-PrlF toxin-antitoxin module